MTIAIVVAPVCLLLLGVFKILKEVNNLPLTGDNFNLETTYSFFVDQNSKYDENNIIDVLAEFEETEFNKAKVDFGDATYWYQLQLRNVKLKDQEIALLLDNPMLDYIDVYSLESNKLNLLFSAGDHRQPVTIEDISFPSLNTVVTAKKTLTLLIKTKTTGTPSLPLALFLKEDFDKYQNAVHIIWGAFIGVILLMALYNLILYLGVKEVLYLIYVGYVACFLMVLGVVHGFISYIVPYSVQLLISQKIIVLFSLVGFLMIAFAFKFLKFDETPDSKVSKIAKGLGLTVLMLAVASLFLVEYKAAQIFFTLQGLVYLVAFVMVGVKVRENLHWAKYYVVSWLPLFVGAAVGPLMLTGNLEYNFWTRHALLLGVMFEMTFISMALAERLRRSETDRLYQASHDHLFGFANTNVLDQSINRLSTENSVKNFSIVAVSITKYDSMVPYLSTTNLKSLVYKFVEDLENHLGNQLILVEFDTQAKFSNVVMLREGVFAVLISSNDEILVTEVLRQFASKQPFNYALDNLSINLSCKVGVAAIKDTFGSADMISKAQQAIDIASEKNVDFFIHNANSESEEGRRVQLASELQDALGQNSLDLYHQPQLCLETNKVIGSEVLVRWNHEKFGFVPPDEFVAVAENTGLINKLSEWVFDRSCEHLSLLQSKGLKDHRISVNFSAHDVVLDSFTTTLVKLLKKHNVKADRFTLELTETVFVSDPKNFNANLIELKELGFKIAMDDFGTGYSSLSYVSQHPFDEIKIDRSFIIDLDISTKHQSIVNAILSLSESLGYIVVAEGIETNESLSYLKEKGCQIGQGYLFSKPVPIDSLLNWMDEEEIKQAFGS